MGVEEGHIDGYQQVRRMVRVGRGREVGGGTCNRHTYCTVMLWLCDNSLTVHMDHLMNAQITQCNVRI